MRIMHRLISRYKQLSIPLKAAIWFTICNIAQRGIQFISMPIFTRIVSTEQYGIYTTFLSWTNLITVVSSLGIYGNVFNKAMVKYEINERKKYISSVQSLTTLLTLIISAIFIVAYACGILGSEMNIIIVILLVIYLFSFPTMQYWYQMKKFEYQYKIVVIITLFITGLSVLSGIFAVQITDYKGIALIASSVLIQAFLAVYFYIKILVRGKTIYNKEYWRWSLCLALPLVPSALSEILLGHADRLMISHMQGLSCAAIYSTVYQISMVMAIVRTGINGAYIPWLYKSLKEKETEKIRKIIRLILDLFFLITAAAMFVGPELLKIVAPSRYFEAIIDIPAVMVGCFFVSVYYIIEQIEFYYEKVVCSSIVSIIGAVLNIVLNYLLIPRVGYLVAGYTTMISYGMMTFIHIAYYKHMERKVNEISGMISIKFIISIMVSMILLSIFCLILYSKSNFYRYCIIAMFVIVSLIKYKDIMKNIQIIKR